MLFEQFLFEQFLFEQSAFCRPRISVRIFLVTFVSFHFFEEKVDPSFTPQWMRNSSSSFIVYDGFRSTVSLNLQNFGGKGKHPFSNLCKQF
jgi:hypothetical protein